MIDSLIRSFSTEERENERKAGTCFLQRRQHLEATLRAITTQYTTYLRAISKVSTARRHLARWRASSCASHALIR